MGFLRVLIFFIVCAQFSCRKPEESPSSGALTGILGFWQGIVKTAKAGSETVFDVSLNLTPDNTFEFRKLGNQGLVTGTYDNFPQLRSLTLRVEDSDVQELAIAGSIKDFEYQLFDGELLLNGIDSLLRLKRPEGDWKNPSNFHWLCSQADVSWELSFSGSQFLLYLENPKGASIFLKGQFSIEADQEEKSEQRIVMFVEDGQPLLVFSQLTGVVSLLDGVATGIELIPYDTNQKQMEALSCVAIEPLDP